MIDLHYWTTPNGHKIAMFLEETGLAYRVLPVNLQKDEQFREEFLRIAPNNKMPAIVDNDPADCGAPISLFESGAILQYLAEKTGKLMPSDIRGTDGDAAVAVLAGCRSRPMAGQLIFFKCSAERHPFGIERHTKESARLFGVLDKRLAGRRIHRR